LQTQTAISALRRVRSRVRRVSSASALQRATRSGAGIVDLAAADDHTVLALRKRTIGYVSQFLKVPPRVTAVEVVARSLIERGVRRAAALAEATTILERLHLPADLFDAYLALFSGGEQQRVNIAA
jgi:alpha-D-ribose 1-methylphosphonate 5-triphosphate synthase subunit PhnL